MQLTIASWDDRVFPIHIDADEDVATLMMILEAEAGVAAANQQLMLNGRLLEPGQKLAAAGVADGDLLMLMPRGPPPAQGAAAGAGAGAGNQRGAQDPAMVLNADGSAQAPAAFIQAVKGNAALMTQFQQINPSLARAVRDDDISALQEELRGLRRQMVQQEEARRRDEELAMADPFDVEAQARIEERIREEQLNESLMQAMEHTPEAFAQVPMLYVNMEVNGVPVKAFVDSGAQMTIMTKEFADKCYLTRLINKRFAGMAVGVGSSPILGKVFGATLKVGEHLTTTSLTVLEQREGPQFIFGLDMLKAHRCVIDLSAHGGGELRFGSCNAVLPFLPENQIPKDFSRHIDQVSQQEAERRKTSTGDGNPTSPSGAQQAAGTAGAPSTAAAPPPQQPAAPQPVSGQQANADFEEKVARLMALGCSRAECEAALRRANGNEDMAGALLFGGDF